MEHQVLFRRDPLLSENAWGQWDAWAAGFSLALAVSPISPGRTQVESSFAAENREISVIGDWKHRLEGQIGFETCPAACEAVKDGAILP